MKTQSYPSEKTQCFIIPEGICKGKEHWYYNWHKQFVNDSFWLSDNDTESFANLIPLLLCGEQSAVVIFNQHATMSREQLAESYQLFIDIESDEYLHEKALQGLLATIPAADNLHKLKRRSQVFFSSLSKDISLAEQFARISQLDSCVCKIMHAMSNTKLGRHHILSKLCDNIKRDEARHVSISRKHALNLGLAKEQMKKERDLVTGKLLKLLEPMANYFDQLEVDPGLLFKRIGAH